MAISKEFIPHTELKASDLNELVTQVNGYIAEINAALEAAIASSTSGIERQAAQSEEQAIIFETDGGTQVGKIDANGADFANLKRGGQQVARMADLPTKDSSIGENPSNAHVPTTKAVKDYIDANAMGDFPISKESTQSEDEEFVASNDAGTDIYAKIGSYGVKAKKYFDINGNPITTIPNAVTEDGDELFKITKNEGGIILEVSKKGLRVGSIFNIDGSLLLPNFTNSKISSSAANLGSNDVISLGENNIKNNKVILFSSKISVFDTIIIGIGHSQNAYGNCWLTVDNTNITLHRYTTSDNTIVTAHGIAIDNTLSVSMKYGSDGIISVRLESDGYLFEHDFNAEGHSHGDVYVKSLGSTLTECTLMLMSSSYEAPVHFYGDSYFVLTSNTSWCYYMEADGYADKVLIDGYPGKGSSAGLETFMANIKRGLPKYAVWCLGMNNADSTIAEASSEPNVVWLKSVRRFIAICKENGITPILCTIPTVWGGLSPDSGISASRYHKAKNDWIRNSGERYIDFAYAVGADDTTGLWYNDGLVNDFLEGESVAGSMRVHPTQYGARALYSQMLKDFPEIVYV